MKNKTNTRKGVFHNLHNLTVVTALAATTVLLLLLSSRLQTQDSIEQLAVIIAGMTLMATFAAFQRFLDKGVAPSVKYVSSSACFELVAVSYEMSGLVRDTLHGILNLLKSRKLTPNEAIAATIAIHRVTQTHRKLVVEMAERLQPNDKLLLTENDKGFFTGMTSFLLDIATDLDNDPAILSLDSATCADIIAKVHSIKSLASQLATLIREAPTSHRTTANLLSSQIPRVPTQLTAVSDDKLFAEIYAEVKAAANSEAQPLSPLRAA